MRNKDLGSLLIGSMLLLTTMALSFAVQKNPEEDASMTGLKTRIETPFLQESIAFYTELLGMVVLESWDDNDDKGVILGLGTSAQAEAFLELAYVDAPKSYTGMSLQFRVRDLAVVAESLRGHWAFRGPEERPWGSTYLYMKDPTGVQVILYEGEL